MTPEILFGAIATWASFLFAAAFIAALGGSFLEDRIGRYATHVLDALMMIATIYGLTLLFVTGHDIVDVQLLYGIGLAWSISALGAEIVIGHFLFKTPWGRLRRLYDIRTGQLYSMVLLALLVSPYVASLHAAALQL
ncbi:MAG: hypothetical protein KJO27_14795 [Gammaproteobacteria bacterium]|nr:hypothetical protein [Gammaproteobacteria bacterium]NNL46683.1 hypothetical protein [Woeseiaceae bacterium]